MLAKIFAVENFWILLRQLSIHSFSLTARPTLRSFFSYWWSLPFVPSSQDFRMFLVCPRAVLIFWTKLFIFFHLVRTVTNITSVCIVLKSFWMWGSWSIEIKIEVRILEGKSFCFPRLANTINMHAPPLNLSKVFIDPWTSVQTLVISGIPCSWKFTATCQIWIESM